MELSNLYNEILLQLYANCYVIMVKVGQGKNPKGDIKSIYVRALVARTSTEMTITISEGNWI